MRDVVWWIKKNSKDRAMVVTKAREEWASEERTIIDERRPYEKGTLPMSDKNKNRERRRPVLSPLFPSHCVSHLHLLSIFVCCPSCFALFCVCAPYHIIPFPFPPPSPRSPSLPWSSSIATLSTNISRAVRQIQQAQRHRQQKRASFLGSSKL
ncbi:MAG: hypothetical protein JOS17DRAFT_440015 [Linnemannia elongata]|nr:MAG: hypothetical protein JOS17DRAFT_440015 [Linnemannia elongata]